MMKVKDNLPLLNEELLNDGKHIDDLVSLLCNGFIGGLSLWVLTIFFKVTPFL